MTKSNSLVFQTMISSRGQDEGDEQERGVHRGVEPRDVADPPRARPRRVDDDDDCVGQLFAGLAAEQHEVEDQRQAHGADEHLGPQGAGSVAVGHGGSHYSLGPETLLRTVFPACDLHKHQGVISATHPVSAAVAFSCSSR